MNNKPYKPAPHPMQHRLDQFRVIPSMVTGGTPTRLTDAQLRGNK